MMVDGEIRVPKLQIIVGKSAKAEATVLDGIERAVKPFIDSKAGPWTALQFLTETDPNLRSTPLSALKAGKIEAAEQAARSHLGLDEG
jgi:predicted lipoprotein